ncbi:hypothetical protein VTN77DRAFT_4224 [Rasamsonia byssochlamydoides]|uniref:uncharacterized protein n=1 Tax=Rasamsonia byssochlamydoides TaxID=89139 RepID=UPI0037421E96
MESLVYKDSPLADYLEGEGERDQDWPLQVDSQEELPSPPPNYAPRGASTFQERIRKKLPAPLEINSLRRSGTLGKIRDACSVAVSSRIGQSDNERFLEQFGYVIVASQLLNEHNAPSYSSATDVLANAQVKEPPSFSATFGLQGAVVTAATSFSIVWLIHWGRSRNGPGLNPRRVVVLLILLPLIGVIFYAFARRQWLKFVRHQAVQAASLFIGNAQSFDSAASASVVFIQEVELVSRGYRISTPLPPISRLEESTSQIRRCLRLRRTVSECLSTLLERYVQAQHTIRLLADTANLEKYYDIYEISTEELREAESAVAERGTEDQYSLRSLRTLFGKLYTVRKSILCCLLALSADGSGSDITTWSTAVEEMRDLAAVTGDNIKKITNILSEQDREVIPPSPLPSASPGKNAFRAQFRRLNSLSQGIRALHAKMHVIREESDALERAGNEQELGATLMAQYESIGADIRGLLQEWEAGKSALMSSLEQPGGSDRLSRASSEFRSPSSPAFSGDTAVDESPTAALRVLNGESQPPLNPDDEIDEEEIFEAVVLPRKRHSMMTREERIARVKEERARQAAARERADANTNMLRELETVIKHLLEARLEQASLLKRVVDAIKDLVQDCNFDCNDSGIALQAMDNSHVALVSMILKAEGFSPYRCDRNLALGINLVSLTKVLRAAQNEDILTLKADDSPDVVNLTFESAETDRISEYDIKLMDIDQEHLAIPETEYSATVEMPSAEFQRICRDLNALSESVVIEATKDGIKFSCQGDIGSGSVTVRQHTNVEKPEQNVSIQLSEPVALTFSLKYLVNFCKATSLSSKVQLCLSQEVPLRVEYPLGSGYLRFFLAPKIGEEE